MLDSIVTSANWLNAGPLKAVCYPLSEKNLTFKATYSYKRNQLYDDEYVEAVVREEAYAEMEQILSQYYTDFYLDVRVITPVFQIDELSKYEDFASIEDVSIASYEEKYGEKMDIHYDVAINNNEISDVDEIKQIFQEYTGNFNNAMLIFQCCFVSEDFIEEWNKREENDLWENFYMDTQIYENEIRPLYTYIFKNGEFYLYELLDTNGFQRFDSNGNNVLENEE